MSYSLDSQLMVRQGAKLSVWKTPYHVLEYSLRCDHWMFPGQVPTWILMNVEIDASEKT